MKLKGFKIDGTVYFVTDAKIVEHGSLENAAKAVKASKEKPIEIEKPKKVKAEKVVEKIVETESDSPDVDAEII